MSAAAEPRRTPPRGRVIEPDRRGYLLLQEKWVMFIVDTLADAPKGFNEISRTASCINPATLSQRLALLEREGIVTKTTHSTMPPRVTYALTAAGSGLLPVLASIRAWSTAHLRSPAASCGQDD